MKATFPISKRVFLSVYERPAVPRAERRHWFNTMPLLPVATTRFATARGAGCRSPLTHEFLMAETDGAKTPSTTLTRTLRTRVKAVEEVAKRLPARIDWYHVGVIDPQF
jgi:hypothetical protein